MKTTIKMLVAVITVAITFTSCNNEQNNPASLGEINSNSEPHQTDIYSGPGATFIGLQMVPYSSTDNFFYYGPMVSVGNRQEFREADFTDAQNFFTVTAENGLANYHGLANPRMGVWDQINSGTDGSLIDDNEVLVFTLGTDIVAGVKMVSVAVNLDGGGTASINLYDGVTPVGNVVATGSGTVIIDAGGALFTKITFAATAGSYGIVTGSNFHLASTNFIGVTTLNGTGNKYAYSNVIGTGMPNRQQMDNSNVNGNGTGAFFPASPNNQQWMVATSTPSLPSYFGGNFSWGVGADSRINVGETMSLKKGSSVVKDFIAARIQYRNATAGAVAKVTIKKAGSSLFTWNINLTTSGTFIVSNNMEFDEIVLESQTGTWNPIGLTAGLTRFYNTP